MRSLQEIIASNIYTTSSESINTEITNQENNQKWPLINSPTSSESLIIGSSFPSPVERVNTEIVTRRNLNFVEVNPKPNDSENRPTKKQKTDLDELFSKIREGKSTEDIEFIDINNYQNQTVFRFTDKGSLKYRDDLQKLCRDNYKKLRKYGIVPYGNDSHKQKVVYSRRLFQISQPFKVSDEVHEEFTSIQVSSVPFPQCSVSALRRGKKIFMTLNCSLSSLSEDFLNALLDSLKAEKKLKILLLDPRSLSLQQSFIDNSLMEMSKANLKLTRTIEGFIGKTSILEIRLFHFCGDFFGLNNLLFVDKNLREISLDPTLIYQESMSPSICFPGNQESLNSVILKKWKYMWESSILISPRTKNHSHRNTIASEAEFLKHIFGNFQRVLPWNQSIPCTLQVTTKKVDIYGMTLKNLLSGESLFSRIFEEHIRSSSVKFRILLKNPLFGCDQLENIRWIGIQDLRNSLETLHNLREKNSVTLFDQKVEIRLHNRANYFSYFRFDEIIWILHHCGPNYPSERSILLHHCASRQKEFKDIFKKEWECGICLESSSHSVESKGSISWKEALEAAKNFNSEDNQIKQLLKENEQLKVRMKELEENAKPNGKA